jgi:hypothetical protein
MNLDIDAPFLKIGNATLKRVANDDLLTEWEVWEGTEEIGAIHIVDGTLLAKKVNSYGDLLYMVTGLSGWRRIDPAFMRDRIVGGLIAIFAANGILWRENRSTIDSTFTAAIQP